MEDADNVMKHILARLFEFLYISVYRETTFQEIFKNADPNVFLEAVGITKKDFEVLNKYHVFQENILNNYIHQFFVNESLGSKLNLEDEEIKKQYRNSFDWFGFGLDGESEPEVKLPDRGQHLVDYVRYQVNQMAEEMEAHREDKNEELIEESLEETNEEPVRSEYGESLGEEEISDLDRIIELLTGEKRGMKAGKIADLLNMTKKEVNRILYANKDLFVSDFFRNWKLK